jgi:hypothetical protein
MVSRSSSSNETSSTNQTFDERVAADNGAMVIRSEGGDVVHQSLDGGAIEMAGEVAIEAFRSAEGLGDLVTDLNQDSLAFARETVAQSRSDQSLFFSQLITYGIPAVVLTVVARSYFK